MIYNLMLKNTPVLEWESESPQALPLEVRVLAKDLLPFILRGAADQLTGENRLFNFIVGRRSYSRQQFASEFLGELSFENPAADNEIFNSIWIRRGTTFTDCYWIKRADENLSWEEVSLFKNYGLKNPGRLPPNEQTCLKDGQGFWHRAEDGQIYYYKRWCADIEVMVSGLLDKTNIPHARYEYAYINGEKLCRSKCMCNEDVSIVDIEELFQYIRLTVGERPLNNLIKSYADEAFYLMNIWDYLIDNHDRNFGNWGFLYNPDTMQILGTHPLMDHGCSFIPSSDSAPTKTMLFSGMSFFEVAKRLIAKHPLEFTEPITEADFLEPRQYKDFIERLGRLYYGEEWQELFK